MSRRAPTHPKKTKWRGANLKFDSIKHHRPSFWPHLSKTDRKLNSQRRSERRFSVQPDNQIVSCPMAIFYGRQNILYQLLLYSSFAIIIYYRLLTEHTSGIRKSSESSGNYDLPYLSRNKVVDLLDISLPKNSSKIWIKEHFSQLGKSLARPFVEQPRQVCSLRPMIENKNIEKDGLKLVSPEGFFYVKMPKAASSTLAGMNTRIAIKQGQRLHHKNATLAPHNTTSCTHYEDHVIGAGMW
jgi:hypothetical protein